MLKQGGAYQVCANATDLGSPPSGLASVRANVAVSGSVVSAGQTAAVATSGSFTCGGVSYGYRTANLTADGTLSEGGKTFNITATDAAANSATTAWTVNVDNTPPTATGFQTVNKTGGTAGKAEVGDQVVFTYGEVLHLSSIKSGWTGTSTAVTVALNNRVPAYGNVDTVTFDVNLGTISLGAVNYTNAPGSVFAASMVWNAGAKTVTITLSTAVTDNTRTGPVSTATYLPNSAILDLAGNSANTSVQPTEAGKRHF